LINTNVLASCPWGGELRPISGVHAHRHTSQKQSPKLILPKENTAKRRWLKDIEIIPAAHLLEVCAHLSDRILIQTEFQQEEQSIQTADIDFADVHGQYHVNNEPLKLRRQVRIT